MRSSVRFRPWAPYSRHDNAPWRASPGGVVVLVPIRCFRQSSRSWRTLLSNTRAWLNLPLVLSAENRARAGDADHKALAQQEIQERRWTDVSDRKDASAN